jgi:hypothetical protein
MRKATGMVLALLIVVSAAAWAERPGKVTAVDPAAKTFSCMWKTVEKTFAINEQTVILRGQKPGSWADVKVGALVTVRAHARGSQQVADKVIVQASGPK